jgi:putative tryptophan/tyrosine transport system substrate-binding protein
MRRREFITVLGGAVLTWPLAVRAQPTAMAAIGFLGPTNPSVATTRIKAFEERLRRLGWTKDANLRIDFRWAEGRTERFAELAAELVRSNVRVIVTWGTETAIAVKQATSAIPIVFTIVADPVGSGLVASLSRPGGNATGLSTQHTDAVGKRIDLLREMIPSLRKVAILVNVLNHGSLQELREARQIAPASGIEIDEVEIRGDRDIPLALGELKKSAQALFVSSDALLNANREQISAFALGRRLPTIYGYRDGAAAGGLISFGPNYEDLFRRAADFVDKILRGSSPADIPVEQPTKFELVINLKTAKALGLDVPAALLVRADELIE